ncbi:MAG TPA: hypothetical protein VGM03_12270, partial [Phycisphaerae bacterium]
FQRTPHSAQIPLTLPIAALRNHLYVWLVSFSHCRLLSPAADCPHTARSQSTPALGTSGLGDAAQNMPAGPATSKTVDCNRKVATQQREDDQRSSSRKRAGASKPRTSHKRLLVNRVLRGLRTLGKLRADHGFIPLNKLSVIAQQCFPARTIRQYWP